MYRLDYGIGGIPRFSTRPLHACTSLIAAGPASDLGVIKHGLQTGIPKIALKIRRSPLQYRAHCLTCFPHEQLCPLILEQRNRPQSLQEGHYRIFV